MTADEVATERWWALIGPRPGRIVGAVNVTPFDKARRLAGSYELGGLTLATGPGRLDEWRSADPTALLGTELIQSWPIQVEGPGKASRFDEVVWQKLRRLAALLSLAWGEPWHIRQGPTPNESLSPRLPDPRPPYGWSRTDDYPPIDEPLPSLIAPGWLAIEHDEELRSALIMWHEGILVLGEHPSLATLAFVASIEGAAQSASLRTYAKGIGRMLSGRNATSGVRFRAAVELVKESGDEVLLEGEPSIYQLRSSTVHDALTHGIEAESGVLYDFGQGYPPQGGHHAFALRLAPMTSALARRLLLAAISAAWWPASDIEDVDSN